MPTTRKRHSVTETPRVETALNELRSMQPDKRIDLGELVVLGAQRRVEDLRGESKRGRALLTELARSVLDGDVGIDPEAAREVRLSGWARG